MSVSTSWSQDSASNLISGNFSITILSNSKDQVNCFVPVFRILNVEKWWEKVFTIQTESISLNDLPLLIPYAMTWNHAVNFLTVLNILKEDLWSSKKLISFFYSNKYFHRLSVWMLPEFQAQQMDLVSCSRGWGFWWHRSTIWCLMQGAYLSAGNIIS